MLKCENICPSEFVVCVLLLRYYHKYICYSRETEQQKTCDSRPQIVCNREQIMRQNDSLHSQATFQKEK